MGVGIGFGTCGGTWKIRARETRVEIISGVLNRVLDHCNLTPRILSMVTLWVFDQ